MSAEKNIGHITCKITCNVPQLVMIRVCLVLVRPVNIQTKYSVQKVHQGFTGKKFPAVENKADQSAEREWS